MSKRDVALTLVCGRCTNTPCFFPFSLFLWIRRVCPAVGGFLPGPCHSLCPAEVAYVTRDKRNSISCHTITKKNTFCRSVSHQSSVRRALLDVNRFSRQIDTSRSRRSNQLPPERKTNEDKPPDVSYKTFFFIIPIVRVR